MTRDSSRFLPPDAVTRISRLDLRAREIVEGYLSGRHRSPYFGQSIEFVQHREYSSGDDPRRIDWKAWSKTDKYYIKQYEEETNLRTLLLVDASESMLYAGKGITKYEYGATIGMCLAYLLLKQQDAVGLLCFDDRVRSVVPQSSRKNHLQSLQQGLMKEVPASKSNLLGILSGVANDYAQRGLIVLISDLLADVDGLLKGLNLLRHRGHEVMVLQILDDDELDFPFAGSTRFDGLEESGDLLCDPRALREGYLKAMGDFQTRIRRHCAGQRIDFRVVRTGESPDVVLADVLKDRLGMRGVKSGT